MRTPPMDEARQLYVEQSALSERVRLREDETAESAEPLVIWDVGLGAAANAMAAIHCYEREATAGPVRPLRIISFENDLDSLKLALLHNDLFPYLRHAGPPAILATRPLAVEAACRPRMAARARRLSADDRRTHRRRRT